MQIQFLRPEASLIRPTTGGAVKVFGRRRLMRRRRPLPVSVFCGSQTNSLCFPPHLRANKLGGGRRERVTISTTPPQSSSFVFRVVESLALPRLNSRTTSRLSRGGIVSRGKRKKNSGDKSLWAGQTGGNEKSCRDMVDLWIEQTKYRSIVARD
jgi:hypothetical protein